MSNHKSTNREAEAWNLRLIGHSDLNGYGDGMQLLLKDHYLFVGHLGKMGTTVLDVSDPTAPQVVQQLKNPPNTHTHKVQIADDILIVNFEKFPRGGTGRSEPVFKFLTSRIRSTRVKLVSFQPEGGACTGFGTPAANTPICRLNPKAIPTKLCLL